MRKQVLPMFSRRKFLFSSLLGVSLPLAAKRTTMQSEKVFIHHVYFWLKRAGNQEDQLKLIEGLQLLSRVKTIQSFHIGVPASTHRDVVDRSYAVSWCVFFRTPEDEESYQVDPIHLDFVKSCSHLWERVVVYDSVDV
ncbi:MAG: Dabb family protein [Chitinophagaceae bacterium]